MIKSKIATMIATKSHPARPAAGFVVLAASLLLSTATAQLLQGSQRTLSGTVSDTSHEPLSGAIVEVQNPANDSVQSYITNASGHYTFQRLDGQADYRVWATFRGRRSHAHSISKFDSHMEKVINFVIRSY